METVRLGQRNAEMRALHAVLKERLGSSELAKEHLMEYYGLGYDSVCHILHRHGAAVR